jgi:hypothetical protein
MNIVATLDMYRIRSAGMGSECDVTVCEAEGYWLQWTSRRRLEDLDLNVGKRGNSGCWMTGAEFDGLSRGISENLIESAA